MADQRTNKATTIWLLIPLVGSLLFILLYIIAALLYPGGSQFDKASKGFSWIHNYWCNLLNNNAMNGEYNRARPVAMAAMFILCLTLSAFWYQFPRQLDFGKYSRKAIQFSGIIAMIMALFLSTSYHDTIINMAGVAGLVALTGTFIGLYKMKWYKLFWMGILNLLMLALNNYVYYSKGLLLYLPLIQKITFLFFLLWIGAINISLYRHAKFITSENDT